MTAPGGRLDDATIERARASVSLVSLVAKRVKLRRSRGRWSGLCPFHDEKTPSFGVVEGWRGSDFYHCFGCGAHGDAIEWLQQAEGMAFLDAVKSLLGGTLPDARSRFTPERRQVAEAPVSVVSSMHAARWIYRSSGPARGEIVEKWLESRGLDPMLEPLPGLSMWDEATQTNRPVLAIDQLRFHPRCPVGVWKVDREPEDHWLTAPAMVAPIRDADGANWGVHVTFLAADGNGKAQFPRRGDGSEMPTRKMFGKVGGNAVFLTPPEAMCSPAPLVIGEGIETTWAYCQQLALHQGRMKAAAALSLENLQGQAIKLRDGSLPLWSVRADPGRPPFTLPDAGDVFVLVDADMKPLRNQKVQLARGAKPVRADISGLQRAEICAELAAQAWRRAGAKSVRCVRPRMGMDFNDEIRGRAAA